MPLTQQRGDRVPLFPRFKRAAMVVVGASAISDTVRLAAAAAVQMRKSDRRNRHRLLARAARRSAVLVCSGHVNGASEATGITIVRGDYRSTSG